MSDVASLPEVVSGKINFVEPGNSSDIAQKIIQFHKGKYENIPEKKFFRKDNIKKTLEVY
ncbi:hypothetical protein KKH82_01295 [Patescibacteria group bacterium]|nr:hypothetical protein [Patescibacteria group bacterium]